jgi:peroxiredoxin
MTLPPGAPAPDFSLRSVTGETRALADYADASVLALVQSCNHCPYVRAWESRMSQIQRDYADRGLRLVAVNANDADTHPGDSFAEMQARADEQGFPFDYLHDPEQSLARALGSERTPEVFLFDGARRLVYHGAIDDNRDETAVSQTYLRDAIEATLAGATPDPADTPPVGCTVKWKAG